MKAYSIMWTKYSGSQNTLSPASSIYALSCLMCAKKPNAGYLTKRANANYPIHPITINPKRSNYNLYIKRKECDYYSIRKKDQSVTCLRYKYTNRKMFNAKKKRKKGNNKKTYLCKAKQFQKSFLI